MQVKWLDQPSDGDYSAIASIVSTFWREVIRGEPEIPAAALAAEIRNPPAHRQSPVAVVIAGESIAGATQLNLDGVESRQEMGWLKFLVVEPQRRRKGVGTMILRAVLDRCRAEGRTRLEVLVPTSHGAGTAFAEANGAEIGLEITMSRAPVPAVDRSLLETWVERAGERAQGYSLVAIDGVCPDELLAPFARLADVMNTEPRSPRSEDIHLTPEQVHDNMAAFRRQGNVSWTVFARRDATRELVGYTELSTSEHRPWLAKQGDTAVHPEHRERGIGRWMKAANALRLIQERPEVKQIETYNAGANAAMLSINRAMGFRPIVEWRQYDLLL